MSHGLLASWVEDLAMTSDERGFYLPYVSELWDATTGGSFESVSSVNHKIQISRVEVWTVAEGKHGRWPSNAGELVVFMADVAAVGHFASESTDAMRSHCFLLNK